MKNDQLRIFARNDPFRSTIGILLRRTWTNADGTTGVAEANDITFSVLSESERWLESRPTLEIRREEAQEFMDQLWNCGIRPTEGAGSVGQMAATERHLEDMRRLVFEKPSRVEEPTS